MPKKVSIHIGVSQVDDSHYQRALIPLPCCVNDTVGMQRLTQSLGYDETNILLDEAATSENVEGLVRSYTNDLVPGDLLVITYSGHGSKIKDYNGDEDDWTDETWCLYDRQFIDDEWRELWRDFKEGVNIFLLLDSCHSGTAFKNKVEVTTENDYTTKIKAIHKEYYNSILNNNKDTYYPILKKKFVNDNEITCNILSIAACKDKEEALAGPFLSYFTQIALNVLEKKGKILRNYTDFHSIVKTISSNGENIHPFMDRIGIKTGFFEDTKPFLLKGEDYPDQFENLRKIILFDEKIDIPTKLKGDGLVLELIEGEPEKLIEISQGETEKIFEIEKSDIIKGEFFELKNDFRKNIIPHPWDRAYDFYERLKRENIRAFVEPSMEIEELIKVEKGQGNPDSSNKYLGNWPQPKGYSNQFTWHLDNDFSELRNAREILLQLPKEKRHIKIAQIDTGYIPGHPGLPKNIQEGFNFVFGEALIGAYDRIKNRKILPEQDYHGTATSALLAGPKIAQEYRKEFSCKDEAIGAIPFATVYPIRISDTVALTGILGNAMPFVRAIRKAIELECEVVTMSMGGLPIHSWGTIVNEAYEAGITIVSAAGNSWVKGISNAAPKKLLFPARFDRVIAAAGITFNQEPYVFNANSGAKITKTAGGEFMQGNCQPKRAMKTAIAAYTPNIAWGQLDDNDVPVFLKNGGGTSSATPQVAAAAALWLVANRDGLKAKNYYGNWKQVEAVKKALFQSASKSFHASKKYYGNGSLKAKKALDIKIEKITISEADKAKKARASYFGFREFIQLVILRKSKALLEEEKDELKTDMVAQEILQIIELDPELYQIFEDMDFWDEEFKINKDEFNQIASKVRLSPYSSEYLKNILQKIP